MSIKRDDHELDFKKGEDRLVGSKGIWLPSTSISEIPALLQLLGACTGGVEFVKQDEKRKIWKVSSI